MIRARKNPVFSTFIGQTTTTAAAPAKSEVDEWELRPGGMLVQKRSPDSESSVAAATIVPTIRVKVKYESVYYEIYLSSQSTFGDLKKLMAERTGLHHQDQKIMYKDKERESTAYLDACGVRDRSKLVMLVDPTAHARRLLELRRVARLEKAATTVKDVAAHVDSLALMVSNMKSSISKGKKVVEKDILNLTEQLMTQLIKLDGIAAEGDVKIERGMQARRIQKNVETLDMLKIKNAKMNLHRQEPSAAAAAASVVVTTEWEMFDSLFVPASTSTTTSNSTASSFAAPTSSSWQLL